MKQSFRRKAGTNKNENPPFIPLLQRGKEVDFQVNPPFIPLLQRGKEGDFQVNPPFHPPFTKGERGGFPGEKKRAQGILEYAVLIAAVAAAFIGMRVYIQRAVQANLKSVQNQISARPAR